MEFLVTMTTHVPEGTPPEAVDEVRAREAKHSRGLAERGSLLRLWRPPLRPGEWRTLGLFAADEEDQLEEVLASMPLRVWRTDEVTALTAHPNDPAGRAEQGPGRAAEFLTTTTVDVPKGVRREVVDDAVSRQAERARELAEHGHLERLWMLLAEPRGPRALGLWRAPDVEGMTAILESLPLHPWMSVTTTPLTPHPNDPACNGD
ncbi:muconolactone delta-isomerase [Mycobacterium sp. E2699]|uniref:muconolactone Delta-isomerase family protein n=1 Tax=Mycobacterium sp. E2699 TaxID=1834137 RepID=UPI0008002D5C|nr:muconolactone Delta-isomerase family protein [Mycobacterium sp. E2699]OBH04560.1 muconolactone delta-isomerase [Mycobacterium sp. E2699]